MCSCIYLYLKDQFHTFFRDFLQCQVYEVMVALLIAGALDGNSSVFVIKLSDIFRLRTRLTIVSFPLSVGDIFYDRSRLDIEPTRLM